MSICLTHQHFLGFIDTGQPSPLSHPETTVWLAQAQFTVADSLPPYAKGFSGLRPQQQAVRLLLNQLIGTIDTTAFAGHCQLPLKLDESCYPYRLQPFKAYVCFSHSQYRLACAISQHTPIGVDIETCPIAPSVAERFFHPAEISWLNALMLPQQAQAIRLLWAIKEAYIKKHTLPNLIVGLKVNHLAVATALMAALLAQPQAKTIAISLSLSRPVYQVNINSALRVERTERWWLCLANGMVMVW